MRRAALLGTTLALASAAAQAEATGARVILVQQDATVLDCSAAAPCQARLLLRTVDGPREVMVTASFTAAQASVAFQPIGPRPAWMDRATVPIGPDGRGDRHVTLRANPVETEETADQPAVWRLAPAVASLTLLVQAPTAPPARRAPSPAP